MKIFLPEKVNFIINKLKENGYEAYAVGGCVRDSVLGRVPDDWDITTSATPNETKALFRRTFDTGIEHGTITVLVDKEAFEVTTYRVDGEYEDSRHPREVVFTRSLKEDLLRRDFTINAMAYNEEEGLVDIFGGIEDLQRKMIVVWAMRGSVLGKMRFGFCAQCDLRHSLDFGLKTRRWKGFESLRRHLQISVQSGFRWNWSRCSYRRIRVCWRFHMNLELQK